MALGDTVADSIVGNLPYASSGAARAATPKVSAATATISVREFHIAVRPNPAQSEIAGWRGAPQATLHSHWVPVFAVGETGMTLKGDFEEFV